MHTPQVSRAAAAEDDTGFTILELVVAISLFAIIVTALAASGSSGLRLVTSSNSRQTATQLVVEQMEALRARTFDTLGHAAALTQSADPDNPDSQVSPDGASYTVPDIGTEPLAIDSAFTVDHGPQPYTRNGTQYTLYRYVTAVDDGAPAPDPNPDFKRVTIVVQWRGTSRPNTLSMSSSFSRGGIEFKAPSPTTPPTSSPTSTTTPGPTTTTTTVATCADTQNPKNGDVNILAQTGADTGYTRTPGITLELTVRDDCPETVRAFVSNDGGPFSPLSPGFTATIDQVQMAWSIPAANGDHTVAVYYADGAGRTSPVYSDTVRLDAVPPGTPSSFSVQKVTVKVSGKDVNAAYLSWGATTDNDTLVGYRIYRKVGNVASMTQYAVVASGNKPADCKPSSTCSFVDSGVSAGNQYTYAVAAYDAAGNETATGEVSVSF